MRTIFLTLAVAVSLAVPASGQQNRPLKFDRTTSSKSLPVKQPRADNSCAAYGAGFVKIEGTSTCVQIGGSIGIGVGGSVRGR
jgi:hypothetical protein